ncbi:MAG: sigma-54-dependent Fis family transcriptional regulator [Gammaproteobacteria bacterium]|nr:sigma-54-dependent Fis family transcriptional regulator [Gammaproteobacteria bacterium]
MSINHATLRNQLRLSKSSRGPRDINMQQRAHAGAILIVDDDQDMLRLVSTWLSGAGYATQGVSSGTEALTRIAIARPDIVITDLFMEGMDGLALVSKIHADNPLLPVIMLSGQAQISDAIKATHLGTAAFLTKPITKEVLLQEIAVHMTAARGARVNKSVFDEKIIHRSPKITELIEQAELLALSDISVFISGETGTGKEALARAMHAASPRHEQTFVGINCGAIPEQLLESELFGHEKGAFTGASARHEGLFLAANGGTLFLDEIGDMPHGLQVKLLRVLQDLEVRPVGSTKSISVDVRIISATHHDLDALVKNGDFREDLYYRLNVVPIYLPSLAARREDIGR